MLSRKLHDQSGTELSFDITSNIKQILTLTYDSQLQVGNKIFEVFGRLYADELLLAVMLIINDETDSTIPVTMSISIDMKKKDNAKIIIEKIMDSIGIFFDEYFSNPDWNDYISIWTEAETKKVKFYYKTSRENIKLSLMADELLNNDNKN